MSETILEISLRALNASQKATLRKALGRSTSMKRGNEVIASIAGIADFAASDADWQTFREAIAANGTEFLQESPQEYGDFQTPLSLAKVVCQRLFDIGYRPKVLIEPTCGKGNFIIAALEVFSSLRKVFGLEIQGGYVSECKARLLATLLSRPELKREIHINQGNIFAEGLTPSVLGAGEGEILILGNPPWVTNTMLSALDSTNLPVKSNFKGHSGLDAITGKSNFDIAEFILLQLIRAFMKSRATVAMLCKNTVIRNLVEATKEQALPIGNLRAFTFDAGKEFGVAADASLFVADITNELGAKTCALSDLRDDSAQRVFGWVGKNFVADVALYKNAREIEGVSPVVWRQGIKHDCADIMELTEERGRWRNGAGELVDVERDRVFPLAKSSDLKSHIVANLRRDVIVPQETVGEDTTWLKQANPRLWNYLSSHSDSFNARRSVIYKGKPPFSIFGVGDYSFKPYKVAMSGLYKSSHFSLLLPVNGKPVMLDDTCYLLGFDTIGQAVVALGLLNSQPSQDFLKSIVFPDSKRPYTKDILMRIDLQKVASLVSARSVRDYLSKLGSADLDFEETDFELFSSAGLVEEQTMFIMERSPAYHAGAPTLGMLAFTIYISFLGVLVLMLLPKGNASAARKVALLSAVAGLFVAVVGLVAQLQKPLELRSKIETVAQVSWIPSLGIEYHLAADGISLTLVLLTGIAAVAGILFSWNIEHRAKEFFAFYLALIGGVYGVFLSFDLFLLFVFYEIAIIPKYFIIAIWGSTRREYGAMKLALYSFVGSAMVLVGLIAAYVKSGAHTMSIVELAKYPFPPDFQMGVFPLVFVGFAILAGLWPFHTWAPTGHVAAPTAASMLLAGVVMKLGAYGCLRVAMTVFPGGMADWGFGVMGFHSWRDVFAVLAVIGIVYGAMVALVQKDFKFVIGYSSVSHMGFVLLGLVTLNTIGLSGAVLQMFSHGVIAGLLFAVVGRMVYDRTHTRELSVLEGMGLSKAIPFAAVTFVIAGVASMGLPGFSGFVAELQVIIGAWKAYPTLAVITGIGILVGVAYTLRVVQKAFFGEGGERGVATPRDGHGEKHAELELGAPLPPISIPERVGAVMLIGASLVIGLYPRLLLDVIIPSFDSPLFDWLRKGGGQ